MKICITGTPGTGKTEIAKALSEKIKFEPIDLNKFCQEKKCFSDYDKKRKCKIVDTRKLNNEIKKIKYDVVLESHYSHDLDCDFVILLRTNPKVLRKRLEKRKWSKQKIQENIDSEIMEVIKSEVYAKYLEGKVIEVETSGSLEVSLKNIISKLDLNSIMQDLKLPENLRKDLKTPFGKLFRDMKKLKAFLKGRKSKIITVGDETSLTLIDFGIRINLIIFDNKVKRKPDSRLGFKDVVVVKNPAGWITMELYESVKKAMSSKRSIIRVVGEEDLAVLPCILFAAKGSLILYGQPNEGVVVVEVNKAVKQRAHALIEKMM